MYRRIVSLMTLILCAAGVGSAAELVQLRKENIDAYKPQGKEVDAIYGDYVLRNDHLVAVVANENPKRSANMMVRGVAGALIDVTTRENQSDQMLAYYTKGSSSNLSFKTAEVSATGGAAKTVREPIKMYASGDRIAVTLTSGESSRKGTVSVRYSLGDDDDFLLVETTWKNTTDGPIRVKVEDTLRVDRSKDQMAPEDIPSGETDLYWAYDRWFEQAYGVMPVNADLEIKRLPRSVSRPYLNYSINGASSIELAPGKSVTLKRRLIPGRDLIEVKARAARHAGTDLSKYDLTVTDKAGNPVDDAEIELVDGKTFYGGGRTDAAGKLSMELPSDKALTLRATKVGYGTTEQALAGDGGAVSVTLQNPGFIVTELTSGGKPIPAKFQFRGLDGTETPFFGPDHGIDRVHNLVYSKDGKIRQALAPGSYEVIASYGPEYDALFQEIEIERGKDLILTADLKRSVNSEGWVSGEFHSHSSPSGDNISDQLGRVHNLLSEHIEFAPCTEHNRIDTYEPHLKTLGAVDLMATCSGMELTGMQGDLAHHNAFPLVMKPGEQDGGAPVTALNPVEQIERLALWDDDAKKVVQQNHPGLGRMFFDKANDGAFDGGYPGLLPHMDIIEVHPAQAIFQPQSPDAEGDNRILQWMQILNRGMRVPGVINADAHANFHGSGFRRNYLKSSTDNAGEIDTMEMVDTCKRGNIVMSTAPFMDVSASAGDSVVLPGDDLKAEGGKVTLKVRVECANWYDVDRVQVFVNGRMEEKLNFTRATHPDFFRNGAVKFEQKLELELETDAHVIVATIGENFNLSRVMGPKTKNLKPVAVANPIYVDVDGNGFEPSMDPITKWPVEGVTK